MEAQARTTGGSRLASLRTEGVSRHMDGQAFTRVPTSALKVGTKLGAPIFDQKQTKLIAAGMKLTPENKNVSTGLET